MSDSDINIRLRATKGDTSALGEVKREVEAVEKASEQAAEASRKIIDTSGPAPWSGAKLPASKPGLGVDLGHEAALAEAMARADIPAPAALSNQAQAKELIHNTNQFKNELRDLLNLPGERTRDEIERITTAIDILRANAGEARGLAAVAAEGGQAALASRLYQTAALAEKAALIQSTVKASRAAGAAGAAAEREVAGITNTEAVALAAGLRQAGASGGFFSSTMAVGIEKLGLLRIAMWGVAGVAGGALVGGLAAVVGWLAKGAAETPQFQAALQNLHGSTSQLGTELNRTSQPFKDFLGNMSSHVVEWFNARIQEASDGLSVINVRLGIPSADDGKRRLEEMGKAAQDLARDLDAAGAAADRMDQRLSQSVAGMERARAARTEQISAEEKNKLAQVDLAEQQGKYTPEQAEAERQRVRVQSQQARSTTSGTFYKQERDEALSTLKEQSAALADAQAKREMIRANLQEATTLAGDHPTDDQKKQLEQMRGELTAAAQAVDQIDAKVKAAKAQAEAASAQMNANTAEAQTAALQQQVEEAKAERAEKEKGMREELDGIAAAHEERMAGIAASGQAEKEIAAQRLAEEQRYQADRLAKEDALGALQNESDTERDARYQRAHASLLAAQKQYDDAMERDKKRATKGDLDADKAWEAAVPKGRIDARTQNVMGAMGEQIEHHGQLEPGATRDAMGVIDGPSRLANMHGAGWDEPRRAGMGDLMPPASKPDQPSQPGQQGQAGQSGNEAKTALDAMSRTVGEIAKAAQAAAQSVQQSGQKAVAALAALEKSTSATATGVKAATAKVEAAIQSIQTDLKNLEGRVKNGREN